MNFFPIEWMNRELESRLLLTISLLAHSKNKNKNIFRQSKKIRKNYRKIE